VAVMAAVRKTLSQKEMTAGSMEDCRVAADVRSPQQMHAVLHAVLQCDWQLRGPTE
jgi:hypothetical protein